MTRPSRSNSIAAVTILSLTIVLSAAVGAVLAHGPGHNPIRHQYSMKNGIPAAYDGKSNPLRPSTENLGAGKRLYKEHCALCHGAKGDGRGPAAKDLKPKPPSLAGMSQMPMMKMRGMNLDAYSFWAISDGGEKLGSAMPAFKDALSETQRWQILLYIGKQLR